MEQRSASPTIGRPAQVLRWAKRTELLADLPAQTSKPTFKECIERAGFEEWVRTRGPPASSRSLPLPQRKAPISKATVGSAGRAVRAGAAHSEVCPHFLKSAQPRERKAKDRSKDPLVYKLTNLVNGHAYVGKAVDSHRRMWEHETGKSMRGKKKGKIQLVDKKIQEYGWANFRVEWLETNVPRDQLLAREAHWMQECGTLVPNGYNILKPGVEVISMDDPVIRSRWEAANPEGVRKSVATKKANREAKLEAMEPAVAAELRARLEKEATRNGKRHRGEELEADGRLGRNDKRRATWEAKREAKMATMNAEDAERYRKKCELSASLRERKADEMREKNRHPDHVAWMKGYRQRTKGARVILG